MTEQAGEDGRVQDRGRGVDDRVAVGGVGMEDDRDRLFSRLMHLNLYSHSLACCFKHKPQVHLNMRQTFSLLHVLYHMQTNST